MANCPHCNAEVVLTAVENPRNGKWTILPLEPVVLGHEGQFYVTDETHEAVDIMGDYAGTYPVAIHVPNSGGYSYRPHSPSHYLGDVHDVSS